MGRAARQGFATEHLRRFSDKGALRNSQLHLHLNATFDPNARKFKMWGRQQTTSGTLEPIQDVWAKSPPIAREVWIHSWQIQGLLHGLGFEIPLVDGEPIWDFTTWFNERHGGPGTRGPDELREREECDRDRCREIQEAWVNWRVLLHRCICIAFGATDDCFEGYPQHAAQAHAA